jgi:hypothetical protein
MDLLELHRNIQILSQNGASGPGARRPEGRGASML